MFDICDIITMSFKQSVAGKFSVSPLINAPTNHQPSVMSGVGAERKAAAACSAGYRWTVGHVTG